MSALGGDMFLFILPLAGEIAARRWYLIVPVATDNVHGRRMQHHASASHDTRAQQTRAIQLVTAKIKVLTTLEWCWLKTTSLKRVGNSWCLLFEDTVGLPLFANKTDFNWVIIDVAHYTGSDNQNVH